ncbi:MAG: ribosome recycling factor [Gammaproteobacteria bacterium]|nr:ribosome recycling factor [Gammaproteobacteria bacterium]
MITDIRKDADSRMRKSIESLKQEFSKVRTGRAQTSILDHVRVSYYGNEMPLSQVATVAATDARMLTVTPWEKAMVPVVEKAIIASNLGFNPSTAGSVIRVMIPPLTEERRRDYVKVVKGEAETARVAIRNVRRDANNDLKDLLKEKDISEDEERRGQEEIQSLTDKYVAEVEKMLHEKEAELMEV